MLRRVDHSTIYLFIAATTTPIALLVLSGPIQIVVLASVWAGAALGIAFALAWIDAPRLLVGGHVPGGGVGGRRRGPADPAEVGVAPFVLFLVGGVLYSAGATIYAARRPDPWPRTFGFHELFHLLVIAAARSCTSSPWPPGSSRTPPHSWRVRSHRSQRGARPYPGRKHSRPSGGSHHAPPPRPRRPGRRTRPRARRGRRKKKTVKLAPKGATTLALSDGAAAALQSLGIAAAPLKPARAGETACGSRSPPAS